MGDAETKFGGRKKLCEVYAAATIIPCSATYIVRSRRNFRVFRKYSIFSPFF